VLSCRAAPFSAHVRHTARRGSWGKHGAPFIPSGFGPGS
jgi:hypothetical protein